MTLRVVIKIFFFLAITVSTCLIPTQIQGKCTQCNSTEVLVSGFCYTKLRGCLRYNIGPVCIECQNGYVLNKTTCVRQAQFNNNTNLSTIPPVVINNPTLTLEDIKNKVGEEYSAYASQANDYFITKYAQLNNSKMKGIQKLETKKGIFMFIEYKIDNGTILQTISFFNNSGIIKQWSFGSVANIKNDPFKANIQIRNAIAERLKDYFIYQITQQSTTLTLNYMNLKNDIIRVTILKTDINVPSPNFITKLTIKSMSLADLVQQLIIPQYPKISSIKISGTQKFQDYHIIYFNSFATISYRFVNYNLIINKLIENNIVFQNDNKNPTNFSILASYSDQKFTTTIQLLTVQLPQIIGAQIIRVQTQTTQIGTNYIINLKKSIQNTTNFDQYQFKTVYYTNKTSQLLQCKKNTKIIYTLNYNYNFDQIFFTYYKSIQNTTNITNIPPISSVIFKNTGNKKYYKIIYEDKQYAEMEYLSEIDKINVLSYTIDGENILVTLLAYKPFAIKRSSNILLNFLIQKQPNLNNIRIKQIIQNIPYYTLIVVSDSGTYKIVIDDQGGQLSLNQQNKISNITCFTMSIFQIQNNTQIISIDKFIKNTYQLQTYSLYLVQINILANSIVYRFLYANNKIRQVQIYLQQNNNYVKVVKASFINYGYSILDSNSNNNVDYLTITNFIDKSQLQGTKVPFFVQSNDTTIKAYYNDGKSIYQVLYYTRTSNGSITTLYTRNYMLVPQGFNLTTMLFPTKATLSINETVLLARIAQQTLKKYSIIIKDSILAYVDRKTSKNYVAMFKNAYGYMRTQATLNDNNRISIGRLTITGYQQNDFTNCSKLSSNGKCLSCDNAQYIEYQGACHQRLQGCLIQAATLCIKCNADYVKSQFKCYKECPAFFK